MTAGTLTAARTVLVADDTAFVRDRFQSALAAAGHRVIGVRKGPELLARMREAAAPIDLVLLDLRLPQARGLELLRAVRRVDRPQPTVVVFSGTIASALEVGELEALGVAGFINEYTSAQHIIPSLAPHLFPAGFSRRRAPRAVLGIPVTYRFGQTIASALTLNISRGGLALRTTSPLAVGTAVTLRFKLPGGAGEVDCAATVVWVDRRVGMGLQFTTIAASDERAIAGFVHAHFFTNRKA